MALHYRVLHVIITMDGVHDLIDRMTDRSKDYWIDDHHSPILRPTVPICCEPHYSLVPSCSWKLPIRSWVQIVHTWFLTADNLPFLISDCQADKTRDREPCDKRAEKQKSIRCCQASERYLRVCIQRLCIKDMPDSDTDYRAGTLNSC